MAERARTSRRVGALWVLGAAAVLLVSGAQPASADPARPTNIRSTVTSIVPPSAPVQAAIVGGDAFIEVRVSAGHIAVVAGYEGEPYLRVDPDGRVEENVASPSHWLNRSRLATTTPPPGVDAHAAPQWHAVGGGGKWVWHDHRTHWMGVGGPPEPVNWQVPMTVDGLPVTVNGTYAAVAAPSPAPWWVALAAVIGLAVLVGRRITLLAAVMVVAGATGFPVAWSIARLPASSLNDWTGVALLALAVAAGLGALMYRRREAVAGALLAGGGLALLLWGGARLDVLTHAVLVTDLPDGLDRFAVVETSGVGLVAIAFGAWAAVRRTPALPPGAPRMP